jgi:hypothetical protein
MKMKIVIATPMYGGNSKSVYVSCLTQLTGLLNQSGHQVNLMSITNESLITRARNTLAHMFIKSDADALLFIDGDHGWVSEDIVKMVNSGKDLIGAIYPMKSINWDNVRKAALAGRENLELYSGNFAVNFLADSQTFKADEPFKVRDVGTGMMFIRRNVFEEMAKSDLVNKYKNNSPSVDIEMGEEITEYFTTYITPEPESILLSEDYAFCDIWRKLGHDAWAAPWVRITHAGEYNFPGYFLNTLEIQGQIEGNADATASQPVPVELSQSDSLQSLDTIISDSESE